MKNNVGLAGMYCDQETSLCIVGDRYYDPKSGRWITPDRMSVAWHVERWQANMGKPTRIPLEANPYVYVANNPLRWVDRTGRFLDDWEPSSSITYDPIRWGLPDGTWNGNLIPGFTRQDNVCTLGPLSSSSNRSPCVRQCCVMHDACYTANQCNASSWFLTGPLPLTRCGTCNWMGAICALTSPTRDCESCKANEK